MLDWDTLRVVLSIHRNGGLSGASRDLKISQPTVSRQLARAETHLDCRLFDRRKGRLAATEAGLIVVGDAEAVERRLKGMQDAIRSIDRDMSGTITVSAPHQLFPYILADELVAFHQLYPDIVLNLQISDRIEDLNNGKVDVVFRAEDNPKPSYWGKKLGDYDLGFFAHRSLIEKFGGNTEALPDKDGLPLVVHEGVVLSSEDELLRLFPNGQVVARSQSLEGSVFLTERGMGVVRLPWFVGSALDGVEAIKAVPPKRQRSLWVLTHKDLKSVRRIERLIEFLADRVSAADLSFRQSRPEPLDPQIEAEPQRSYHD